MENILISVIVPAYNIEKYIGRCIESILNQTYRDLEIIIVDDGSTDQTGNIIDLYAANDGRIKSIHKENGGVSSARLKGIEASSGSYVGFVDGDDYIEPEMFEKLLNNALHYQADISHCGYKMVFPDGHENLYYGTGKVVEQNHDIGLIDLIKGDYIDPGLWNKLYKREVVSGLERSAIWDEKIKINEDLLMNYIFFSHAEKTVYEDKVYYHYILRKGSAATSKQKRYKIQDPLTVITLIKEDSIRYPDIYPTVYSKYLRVLINTANQNEWKTDALEARRTLRKEIKSADFNDFCTSFKLRNMVRGVVYAYPLYSIIRLIYDKLTGASKKYDIA